MNNVKLTVVKTHQSPTTPVVKLSYVIDIESEFFGENGVFDAGQEINWLISILEKHNSIRLGFYENNTNG